MRFNRKYYLLLANLTWQQPRFNYFFKPDLFFHRSVLGVILFTRYVALVDFCQLVCQDKQINRES